MAFGAARDQRRLFEGGHADSFGSNALGRLVSRIVRKSADGVGRHLVGRVGTESRRLRHSRPACPRWLREWHAVRREHRVIRPIRFCVTASLGPLLCRTPRGYTLAVPRSLWHGLSSIQRLAILRHELAHYRRGDVWMSLLARSMVLVHWFSPFAWLAPRRFEEGAEWACDEAAIGERRELGVEYAKALLRLGQQPSRNLVYAAASPSRHHVALRIRRMLAPATGPTSSLSTAILLLGLPGSVALSPDGTRLACGAAGVVKRWDTATGTEQRRLDLQFSDRGGRGAVKALCFSPDGKTLAAGGAGPAALQLWEVSTGRLVERIETRGTVYAAVFAPDGRTLAFATKPYVVIVWDIAERRELYTLQGHYPEVSALAFSPDCRTLASGSLDRTIKLWDVRTGGELAGSGDTGPGECVAFSADGHTLAWGTSDGACCTLLANDFHNTA